LSEAEIYLGLMSGTSVDGIDAAIVRFTNSTSCEVLFACTYPMDSVVSKQVLRVSQADAQISLNDFAALDTALGQCFADAALRCIKDSSIDAKRIRAIGSHGQTLRHQPYGQYPFSLQAGDANVIAERTGLCTVADFRRRDVAAGGQGAPLVPAFHAALFSRETESRAILNIGGIANLTLLSPQKAVRGFDTGPGNGLMDAWCLLHRQQRFDANGDWAASGKVDNALLNKLLDDEWLKLPPPKSTGRDQYHLQWLQQQLASMRIEPVDVQATLCAFTAHSIVNALQASQPDTARVIVCGGGVRNLELMRTLRALLPNAETQGSAAHGIDPDFVEAAAFAWLAQQTLHSRTGNLAEVTGAKGLRVLGAVYSA
jgi:anhydro-N-acetylmuramic acid kinase